MRGAEGNGEFLVHGRVGAPVDADRRRLAVEEAVAEATAAISSTEVAPVSGEGGIVVVIGFSS